MKPDDEDGSISKTRNATNWRAPILQEILTRSRWALSRLTRSSERNAEKTSTIAAQSLKPSPHNLQQVSLGHPPVSTKPTKSTTLDDSNIEVDQSLGTNTSPSAPSKRRTGRTSEYFNTPSPQKKPRPPAGTVSCLEVPPLWDSKFGLIQEEFANDPFNLLIAVVFLRKTKGTSAIPIFRQILEMYPTTEELAEADAPTLTFIIEALGLQNQRAKTLITLAKCWISNPPVRGRRHRTLHYPHPGAAKDIKVGEILSDDDKRSGAWEVGHLPGLGPYAFDSWRIFCRDKLRGLADGWNGEGAGPMFEPEWKRVVPEDKELRAILRWLWLKEGWAWNPKSGEKDVASEELMKRAEKGGLEWDAEAELPPETRPHTSVEIHKLGIVQSFPKDVMDDAGTETKQDVKEKEDPGQNSEDVNSEPDKSDQRSAASAPSSSSSHLSSLPGNSDSEEESSEKSEYNESGKDDTETTRSEIVVAVHKELGKEETEKESSREDGLGVKARQAKRRKIDVDGSKPSFEPFSKLPGKGLDGRYHCSAPGCNMTFGTSKNRRRHLRAVHEREKFCCTLCGASLSRKDKLVSHMTKIHATQKDIYCAECQDSFWTTELLNRHIRSVHKGLNSFKCIICDIELSRKDKFDQHLRTTRHKANALEQERNGGEESLLKDVPGDDDIDVLEHVKDVQDESRTQHDQHGEATVEQPNIFKCRVCDVKFAKRSKLQRHFGTTKYARNVLERKSIEMETGDEADEDEVREEIGKAEVFKCTICKVKLSRKDKLENHLLTAKHIRNVAEQEKREGSKKEGKKKVVDYYDAEVFGEDVETSSSDDEDG
jgi:methyl-CpG-binding domain protein 4